MGLYSALAYAVRRRTQEIAIRIALGAQATHVRWLFLKTSAGVVVGGLVLGVPASLVVGRLLQNNVVRFDARHCDAPRDGRRPRGRCTGRVDRSSATRLEPTVALRIE